MSNLYNTIGSWNPSYLLADPKGCDRTAVPVAPGNGLIERGTVLYRTETGMYAPAAAANCTTTNMLVVLDEDVDTSADATIAEDASVLRAAHLIKSKVKLASGAELTAAAAVALRNQGFFLEPFDDFGATEQVFDNKTGD